MQLFCNFTIFMLYHGLRPIMEQRKHCETNYTHIYILHPNDEAEIVNKDDKNNIDDKESGGSGDDDDD